MYLCSMEILIKNCVGTCNCLSPMEQLYSSSPRVCIRCGSPETTLTHIYNQSRFFKTLNGRIYYNMDLLLLDGNKEN